MDDCLEQIQQEIRFLRLQDKLKSERISQLEAFIRENGFKVPEEKGSDGERQNRLAIMPDGPLKQKLLHIEKERKKFMLDTTNLSPHETRVL